LKSEWFKVSDQISRRRFSTLALCAVLTVAIFSGSHGKASANPEVVRPEPVQTIGKDGCVKEDQSATKFQADIVSKNKPTGQATAGLPQILKDGHHPHVALVLGGGGTRGAAHIGVLKVLEENHVPIDLVVGTSMGAIVGGLHCAGLSATQIHDRLNNKKFYKAFNTVPIPVRIIIAPILLLPRLIGFHPYDGLYKGNKFAKYLNRSAPETERQIEELKPQFVAIATNLLDGKPTAITRGNLGRALQASSAVPFLRKPVPIDGKLLVDGGITANLPVVQARELGADIVIAVDVDETYDPALPEKHFRKMGSVPPRVISLMLTTIDAWSTTQADIVIHPNVNNITLLSFKKEDGQHAYEAGQIAAKAALPVIWNKLKASQAN
jgi:NTE family protein